MKRPFIFIAVSLFFALFFAAYASLTAACVLAGLALCSAAAFFILRKGRPALRAAAALLLVAAVGIGYMLLVQTLRIAPAEKLSGQTVQISGIITEEPTSAGDYAVYTVKTDQVDLDGAPQTFKMQLYSSDGLYADALERIDAVVYFSELPDNTKNTYYSENVLIRGYLQSGTAVLSEPEQTLALRLAAIPITVRRYITNLLYTHLDYDDAALLVGIVIGDKSGFSDDFNNALINCGLSHIIAVSGMHLSVICSGLFILLTRLRVERKTKHLITLASVLLVTSATGFTPSVSRAALMFCIYLLGNLMMRKSDTVNSLGLSAVILMLINPYNAVNISFQLSVLSTLGLLLIAPALYRPLSRIGPKRPVLKAVWDYFAYALAATVGAVLFTLPAAALTFTTVSIISPIPNLLLTFAASGTLIGTVLAAIFYAIPFLGFLGFPFLIAAGLLAKYMRAVTEWFSNPAALASFYEPYAKLILASVLILIACALLVGRGRFRTVKLAAMLCGVIILSGILSYQIWNSSAVTVAVMDVDGICVAVSSQNTAIIGCGEGAEYSLKNYLRVTRKSSGLMILPALNNTYAGGTVSFLQRSDFAVSNLLAAASGKYTDELDSLSVSRTGAENADIYLDARVHIKILTTESGNSTVVTANGVYLLIPAPSLDLSELPEAYAAPDIILCTRAIPSDISADKPPIILIAGSEENCLTAAKRLGLPAYITGGDGNLILTIGKNGNLNIRREHE